MSRRLFRVEWADVAAWDLKEVIDFVAQDSPLNARRLFRKIRKRAQSLNSMPRRGRVVPELANLGIRTFRELVIAPYRLVYRVAENRVYVLAVLDGRRDLEDLLLERLVRQ